MNKAFQEYTTSTAFSIQLTKRQCWGLLVLLDRKQDHWLFSGQFIPIGKELRARGLVTFLGKRKRPDGPCHKLTRAGMVMVMLLKEAGLTMENTRTLSVIKGTENWFQRMAA